MVLLSMASMTIAMLVALGYPFLSKRQRTQRAEAVDELAQRKTSLFQDINDLEFDRDTGKVAEGDYEAMRGEYELEAAVVIQAIDQKPNGQMSTACPSCGQPVAKVDQFCGGCGDKLPPKQA